MKTNHLHATMNQLGNVSNPYQGSYRKVLFACSAGLLRSATAAHVFSAAPYNWNTRSAGTNQEYCLNPVNEALLAWADNVFLMSDEHLKLLEESLGVEVVDNYRTKIKVLDVPDVYSYRDPQLVKAIEESVNNQLQECKNV